MATLTWPLEEVDAEVGWYKYSVFSSNRICSANHYGVVSKSLAHILAVSIDVDLERLLTLERSGVEWSSLFRLAFESLHVEWDRAADTLVGSCYFRTQAQDWTIHPLPSIPRSSSLTAVLMAADFHIRHDFVSHLLNSCTWLIAYFLAHSTYEMSRMMCRRLRGSESKERGQHEWMLQQKVDFASSLWRH